MIRKINTNHDDLPHKNTPINVISEIKHEEPEKNPN